MHDTEHPGRHNDLDGTVHGPVVQAGTVHGDVHFHGGAGPAPVPRQLVAPVRHFTNRRSELAVLDDALNGGGCPLVVLSGPGGVGKTAIATRWAYGVRDRFPDGQLYVDLAGFGGREPVDPAEALGGFLRALGVTRGRVPIALAEQAALFRSLAAGRALLIVLDNAYSAAQVRVLRPASSACMVVVTSRNRLAGLIRDGARLIDVGPLPVDDSMALLARTVGEERIARERQPAENLAAICGGLPIALAVAAARLVARPRLSVARIVAELADDANRLSGLSMSDDSSVPVAFDTSYRSLEPATAAMYRLLSVHPGPEFGTGPVAAVLPLVMSGQAAVPSAEGEAVREIEPLLEASLLQEVDENRFRFHDLLRLHARQKAATEDEPETRRRALLAVLEWYLAAADRVGSLITPYRRRLPYAAETRPAALPAPASREQAFAWLELERPNLLLAATAALAEERAELAWHLSDVLWPLFLYRKHYRDRLRMDKLGVSAARGWGNLWAEAHMLKRLGMACATIGDHPEAEQHTIASIGLAERVGDVRGVLEAQECLAKLYQNTGRARQAVEVLREVLTTSRETGEPRRIGLALIGLGRLLPRLGRSTEAIALLREARAVFTDLSGADPYNPVRVTLGLAEAYLHGGDLDNAERAAAEAAHRMSELGSEHGHAEALYLLGQIAERRGDQPVAVSQYRLALRVFEGQGSGRAADVRRRLAAVGQPAADAQVEPG